MDTDIYRYLYHKIQAVGKIVIACYKPKPREEAERDLLMETHVDRLRAEGLVTNREPTMMKSKSEAIEKAHSSVTVQKMWEGFTAVCDYEIPANIDEFSTMFPEFESIN
ncbi:MAG: hypothetical protein AAF731_12145 [Bacteroidota bacterium]